MRSIEPLAEDTGGILEGPDQEIGSLRNQYLLSVQAILGYYEKFMDGNQGFVIETRSLATESIISALDHARIEGDDTLKLLSGLSPIIFDNGEKKNPETTYETYGMVLEQLCKYAKELERTLILGFSSMGGYELLPRISKIIKELRARHKNIICVIGGADFNALPDKEFLDRVFDYGIDIVNIGGATEFSEFFGKLSGEDIFHRDEAGILRVKTDRKIPDNLLFAHQRNNISEVIPGQKISTTFYYNAVNRNLCFTINNNPCLNDCGYCANHIHSNVPLKESDVDDAIRSLNGYLSGIEDDKILLKIDNPNPLQYVDKFERFLQNIDLTKVREIGFFADFLGMGNRKVYEKTMRMLDNLLGKWPDLRITTRFGIDAFHDRNDGGFIGRTLGSNLATEARYTTAFKSFDDFYERYPDNQRMNISFNIIFHPNMKLEDYKERLNFCTKYIGKSKGFGSYPLVPHPNTQIEKDHRGYYMPESEAIHVVDFLRPEFQNLNFWGHLYLQSNLLDIFVFLDCLGLNRLFEEFIKGYEQETEKEKKFPFIVILKEIASDIYAGIQEMSPKNLEVKEEERKARLDHITSLILDTLIYINFVIYRENYIISVNPSYKTEESDTLMGQLEAAKKGFAELGQMVSS